MVRAIGVFAFTLLGTVWAEAVPAVPQATLHWDSCSGVDQLKVFSGPGDYVQVLTVTGLDQPLRGFHARIVFMFRDKFGCPTVVPDAWNFGPGGCQGEAFAVAFDSTGQNCTQLGTANRVTEVSYNVDGPAALDVRTTFDEIVPSPEQGFTMMVVSFDHAKSVVGPTSQSGLCGGADLSACMQLQALSYIAADNSEVSLPYGTALVWAEAEGCHLCEAAQPSTWGRVKASYR